MKIYELIQCEENGTKIESKGMFASTNVIWAYLTHNGYKENRVTIKNHNRKDKEYLLATMQSAQAVFVVHYDEEAGGLLDLVGWQTPEYNEYFRVITHEVRTSFGVGLL